MKVNNGDPAVHAGQHGPAAFAADDCARAEFDGGTINIRDRTNDGQVGKLARSHTRLGQVCAVSLDLDDPRPPYQQVAANLRAAILMGKLAPAERLPSQAELSAIYGLARMTIQQALRVLKNDGLIVSRQGSGTFVRQRPETCRDPIRDKVGKALAAFNELRVQRDSYEPHGDWDAGVFAFDEGLANLGADLADAVAQLLAGSAETASPARSRPRSVGGVFPPGRQVTRRNTCEKARIKEDAMNAAVKDETLAPSPPVTPAAVWLLTVEWGSDGEGGYGWTRRSIHATRERAESAAAELVTTITEEAFDDLTVLRSEGEPDWFYAELDGGGYCPMAYSLEQMPVD